MSKTKQITSIRHPEWLAMHDLWYKYRLTYQGGQDFINEYLQSFSSREDGTEFAARKVASYCPAHAKVAVNEIKDAISERMIDVVRTEGPGSYQTAIKGLKGGVDRADSTMNGFMGSEVLPELLSMGKVGVFIDRPSFDVGASKVDVRNNPPYLYTYTAENILAWNYDENNVLTNLLLMDSIYKEHEITFMPCGLATRYRYFELTEAGVTVRIFNSSGVEQPDMLVLNLSNIPFTIFEIQQSLMTDIANYQIALLNLGSSDLSYAIKSNFPFYTEQFDPKDMMQFLLKSGDGDSTTANTAIADEVKTGVAQGRRYPKGMERPGFIHPSSEPLEASMKKQKALQDEIRELVRLNIKEMSSDDGDDRSVESGLSTIGDELERGERKIGMVWADYERDKAPVVIYPQSYTLRTDAERRAEAKELEEHITNTPSLTLKKALTKQVAQILGGYKLTQEQMDAINKEIDSAEVIITDPEVVRADYEAGLVGTELASRLRGYPEGEVAKAKIDHADRIARIALAQSSMSNENLNGARGVDELDSENDTAAKEKELSRETDQDDVIRDKTRGEGK